MEIFLDLLVHEQIEDESAHRASAISDYLYAATSQHRFDARLGLLRNIVGFQAASTGMR